jgi:hypothetical protein
VHNLILCFGVSLSIAPSHVHTFFVVILNDHLLVYIMFKLGMKNKQYGISFEVATSKLSPCLLFLDFRFVNN